MNRKAGKDSGGKGKSGKAPKRRIADVYRTLGIADDAEGGVLSPEEFGRRACIKMGMFRGGPVTVSCSAKG